METTRNLRQTFRRRFKERTRVFMSSGFHLLGLMCLILSVFTYFETSYTARHFLVFADDMIMIGNVETGIGILTSVLIEFDSFFCRFSKRRLVRLVLSIVTTVLLVTLFFIISIVVLVRHNSVVEHSVEYDLQKGIDNYYHDKENAILLDKMQSELSCCGLNGFFDFCPNNFCFDCTSTGQSYPFICGIPKGCCNETSKQDNISDIFCGYGENITFNHQNGLFWFEDNTTQFHPEQVVYDKGCKDLAIHRLQTTGNNILGLSVITLLILIIFLVKKCVIDEKTRPFAARSDNHVVTFSRNEGVVNLGFEDDEPDVPFPDPPPPYGEREGDGNLPNEAGPPAYEQCFTDGVYV